MFAVPGVQLASSPFWPWPSTGFSLARSLPRDSSAQEFRPNSKSRLIMFLALHNPAPKERVCRTIHMKRAAWAVGLTALAGLVACGGGPSPAKSSPITTGGTSASSNLTVSASLPAATQGTSYAGSVSVTGGASPYNFAVVSGQLPQGLNIDATSGSVSGTPGAPGNFNFD